MEAFATEFQPYIGCLLNGWSPLQLAYGSCSKKASLDDVSLLLTLGRLLEPIIEFMEFMEFMEAEEAWEGMVVFNNCAGDGSSSGPSITNSMSAKELLMAGFALRAFRTCAASCERSTPERILATSSSAVALVPARNIAMMPPRSCLCLSRLFCVSERSCMFFWLAIFLRWSEVTSYIQGLPRVAQASHGAFPEHC